VSLASNMSILRVLRVIRLVKLVRLVRASRLYERWKTRVALSYATTTTLQMISMLLLSAHWYACIMALEASMHDSPQDTWLGVRRYEFCDVLSDLSALNAPATPPSPPGVIGAGIASVTHGGSGLAECSNLGISSWYLAAFSWSIMVITGTGGTDYYPSSLSDGETFIVTSLVLFGALLWTQVLAKFCDVATNANPGLIEFRQQLDGLNQFIADNNLPKEMGRRMREYLHQQQGVQLREHSAKALPRLSTALQIEVVLHCHRHWLDKIWFLKDVDELCRVRLAMSMGSQVLAPGEVAPHGYLYVISRGLVLFGGRVLTHGMAWGDDVLLTEAAYFLPYLARAMTYVDVHTLSRETLTRVIASFPASFHIVRRATVLLTLRRHLIQAARDERIRRENALAGGGDFIDKAHEAASDQSRKAQLKSINMAVELQKLNKSGAALPVSGRGARGSAGEREGDEPAAIAELQTEVHDMREQMHALQEGVETILVMLKEALAQGAVERAPSKRMAALPRPAPLTAVHGTPSTMANWRAEPGNSRDGSSAA